MATIEELNLKVALLTELARKDESAELKAASTRVADLLTAYQQAVAAGQTAAADQAAADITAISNGASQLATQRESTNTPAKSEKWWSYVGMAVLAIVFIALGWFIYLYGTSVGLSRLATIEGTRPLLVIAAITSTIAFGGALLLGSLFSSEGKFEDRFRHAREIFLVFSGIFGTVIGFYFGASDSIGPQLSVSATLEGATLVAYVAGGTPPYKVTATYGPKECSKTEESKQGWVRFTFSDKTKVNLVGAKVSAIDSKALQGEFSLAKTKDDLSKEGWNVADDTPCDSAAQK